MGLSRRSIRLRVGILILVPVFCLMALYGFAASITLGNALTQAHAKSLRSALLTPLGNVQQKLDTERHFAVLFLATPNSAGLATQLSQAENSTDMALDALTTTLNSSTVQSDAGTQEKQAIKSLLTATNNLSWIRNDVGASALTIPQALTDYSAITDQGYQVLDASMFQQSNVPLVTQALEVIGLDQAAQTALEESDLLQADMSSGKFPVPDRILFAQLAAARSSEIASTLPLLDSQYRQMVAGSVPSATSRAVGNLESAVETSPWRSGPAPAQVASAVGVLGTYSADMGHAIKLAANALQDQSGHEADTIFLQLILAAGFGLIGTIVSIVLSLYIGGSLVRQLRELRQSALGLAHDKLPSVISQLRDGQPVDLADYAAPEVDTSTNEIEQVQYAFGIVQQTAVKSAIDEARLRRGISDVFRNLAGRSQSLLHRQLTLLDGMERRATEPEELEDLFRIDHLTTRMRRHAEGLIILSGETPARGWRQPVPLIDVLRAAVAEVEDYTRIRVLARTRAAVSGHAVADVIHLVAELAENATVFSPPNTPVRIQGDIVGKGFAIEIEDRGLGISPDRLTEINRDLAQPPQFDLSDSDRLGLFIAGQLARRHGISITLQPSVYGGTTAIVLIPISLVVDENSYVPDPAIAAGPQDSQSSGRHAALAVTERGLLSIGNGNGHMTDASSSGLPPSGIIPAGALTPESTPYISLRQELASEASFVTGLPPTDIPMLDQPPVSPVGSLPPVAEPPVSPSGSPPSGLPMRGKPGGRPAWLPPRPDIAARSADTETAAPQSLGPQSVAPQPVPPQPLAPKSAAFAWADAPPADVNSAGAQHDVFTPSRAQPAATAGEDADSQVSMAELAALGLPVRVRQANLAPQLRDSGPAAQAPAPAPAPAPSTDVTASPEAAFSTMSALQRGWQLGRAEGSQPADSEEPPYQPIRGLYAPPESAAGDARDDTRTKTAADASPPTPTTANDAGQDEID